MHAHLHGADEVQQRVLLVIRDVLNVLHNQVGGGPHTPNGQEDVPASIRGEGTGLKKGDCSKIRFIIFKVRDGSSQPNHAAPQHVTPENGTHTAQGTHGASGTGAAHNEPVKCLSVHTLANTRA